MKKIIPLLFFFLAFLSAVKAQTFDVSVDTLHLNLKEIIRPASKVDLTHALKYNDKYYCFFEERGLYSFKKEQKYFLIVSNEGAILKNVKVPKEINNTVYYDFFIRNDSLLAKTYMDHFSFYFDLRSLEWKQIEEVDDEVYEDDNFAIKYLDFGEWGQTTWFIDKKTKKEYLLGSSGTIVNKLNDKYYLTNDSKILMIDDPHYLEQSDKSCYYETVEKERKFLECISSLEGANIIYKDSTFQSFSFKKPNQSIATSFVFNEQLFQLVTNITKTYIAKIEKETLIPIQNIGKNYSTYNWYYSYRGNNLENNYRFLKFREDYNKFGFIEIENNKIDIHYLKHNIDSLNYLGSDGFDKLFDFVTDNIDDFSLDKVKNIEESIGGIDLKSDRKGNIHNGYYPNEKKIKIEGTKEYLKVLDKDIAQTTEYFYTSQNNFVKAIFIEWSQTQPYLSKNIFDFSFDEDPTIIKAFNKKFDNIKKLVSEKIGKETNTKIDDYNNIELTWYSKNGLKIKLYFNNKKQIRMIIYKE